MSRLIAQPIQAIDAPDDQRIREELLIEGNFSAGMVSELDLADLPEKALSRIINSRIYLDKLYVSPGLDASLVVAKPNSNKVLKMFGFTKNDGTSHTYRFNKAGLHKLGASSWGVVTGALTGTDMDRFNVAVAFDAPVFTNNGVDPIQLINVGANTFGQLGNAPRYKYVTVFYNRVIGLNLAGPTANPIEVGHSGDANPTQFNPSVDPSAGSTPLIESPGDLNDFITGGVGFSDILVIFRQRSIWVGQKTQVASQPIFYSSNVGGTGCGLPYTITVVGDNRIVFADYIKRNVYVYTPGSRKVEPIGTLNQSRLFDSITDIDAPFGAYDSILDQYHLCIPSGTSSLVTHWIYDFKTNSWTTEEHDNLSSLDFPESSGTNLKIAELVGKISQLSGKIATLGVTSSRVPVDYYGFLNGDIKRESTSIAVTSEMISRQHTAGNSDKDLDISKMIFDFILKDSVTVALYYSKDEGDSWKLFKQKSYPSYAREKKTKFMVTKLLSGTNIMWKLIINGKNWELINHVIKHNVAGDSKQTAT